MSALGIAIKFLLAPHPSQWQEDSERYALPVRFSERRILHPFPSQSGATGAHGVRRHAESKLDNSFQDCSRGIKQQSVRDSVQTGASHNAVVVARG